MFGIVQNSYIFAHIKTTQIKMKTQILNNRNTKAVNIFTDGTGTVRAFYVQFTSNGEQVLQSKDFATTNNATKWAHKILN